MALKPKPPRKMNEELARLGQILLREDSPYRLVGDEIYEQYRDEEFRHLYHLEGKQALSPVDLLFVSAFQAMENLSDREAIEALRMNIGWKYALHLPLDYEGFNYSVLSEFRTRLIKHESGRLLFDRLLGQFSAMGILKKRGRQRTDSLAVHTQLKELNRLELVVETMRLSIVAIFKQAPEFGQKHLPIEWREKYTKRCVSERLNDAERARLNEETGRDGVWLLNLIEVQESVPALKELAELKVLREVWQARFIVEAESVQYRPSQLIHEATGEEGLIQTPHDPEVRFCQKRDDKWEGYKLQVTETDDEGKPHLITDIALTPSTLHDQLALPQIAARQKKTARYQKND